MQSSISSLAALCRWHCRGSLLAASAAATSRRLLASGGGGGGGDRKPLASSSSSPPPRPPARSRPDNAPLYEQMRQERRGATDRLALEKSRAALRRRQFDAATGGPDSPASAAPASSLAAAAPSLLQAARHKAAELPANCLPWSEYALFADPPRLRSLTLSEAEAEAATSFASMLRHSTFVGLGDFAERVVLGRIFERHEGSLYVDFGGKFHAVCPVPRVNHEKYVRGAQVTLRLLDPEMTSRFLGSEKHVTLAEADAVLLGLLPDGGDSGEIVDHLGGQAAADDADEADTVSPLRLSVMQLALAEAEAAAADQADAAGFSAIGGSGDNDGDGGHGSGSGGGFTGW